MSLIQSDAEYNEYEEKVKPRKRPLDKRAKNIGIGSGNHNNHAKKHVVQIRYEPDRPMWDFQPWETYQSFNAFQIYLTLGKDRSLEKCAAIYKPIPKDENGNYLTRKGDKTRSKSVSVSSGTMLGQWSSSYNWRERAIAYDSYLANLARKAIEEDYVEMNRRHAKAGMRLVQIAAANAEERARDLDNGIIMEWGDIVKVLDAGAKIERAAHGEIQHHHTTNNIIVGPGAGMDLGNLSMEEKLNLLKIHTRIKSSLALEAPDPADVIDG